MKTDNTELFEKVPVSKAVIALVVPTVISQVITVVYNMADTFFIGQMNDSNQVAAATLSLPLFMILTAIANLFGIGGASLISRSLGTGDREKAKNCAAFSIWTAATVALAYGITLYLFRPMVLLWLGADTDTYGFCSDYLLWTTTIGSIPTVWNACLSHLVRAEGYSKEASFGVALGGVMNIILDPIFIFPLGLGIAGAAIATMFSNTIATAYFIFLLLRKQNNTVIKFSPKNYTFKQNIAKEIVLVGFPSFVMMLMGTVTNLALNKVVVFYSNQAIAGMGIAKKIDTLAYAIANGMSQGVLPLIAYNYAAQNYSRMRSSIKTAFLYSIAIAVIGTIVLFFGAVPVVRFFINDAGTVAYGQHFLRIICIPCPAISAAMMIITIFQATGQKIKPMILSLLQKGLEIPFILIINAVAEVDGIPWATLIAAFLVMGLALISFAPYWKQVKMNAKMES